MANLRAISMKRLRMRIRCAVITSEGDHFTAGNDIRDFMSNPPTEEDSDVAKFLGSLSEFPKPLLAAVKGNAVGVGTTMLLHCDVVIAAPTASFSMPFTSSGLVPEAGSTKTISGTGRLPTRCKDLYDR
jgi:enoyl-CoA hydratase/carnithine racemase